MLTTKQTNSPASDEPKSKTTNVKSQHKLEGKNKKSLHQKQQANLSQQQQKQQLHSSDSTSGGQQASNRRQHHHKSINGTNKSSGSSSNNNSASSSSPSESNNGSNSSINCVTFEDFAKRAAEIKSDINAALEKQMNHKIIDQPVEVVNLKNEILKLSNLDIAASKSEDDLEPSKDGRNQETHEACSSQDGGESSHNTETICKEKSGHLGDQQDQNENTNASQIESSELKPKEENVQECTTLHKALTESSPPPTTTTTTTVTIEIQQEAASKSVVLSSKSNKKSANSGETEKQANKNNIAKTKPDDNIEPLLNAKLDANSKVVALLSSLQKMSPESQGALEMVCRKLVDISEQNGQLASDNELYRSENQKLSLIKQKLENLCRELQKSNNAIRIESLDLIKVEQGKAKEQTTKIQSTLSGVIKLFDENQQRNMSLRQENQDLQTKLKSLLDHCDHWEKSVEASLRQKYIEIRLIKTELAKANLLKNEEKEKFLGEKQELLQILSMMQEQQHRIEGQEAKLRSDLSSYASKYDECQAVISKGMNRFQTESKKMLKQIEKSKQDYKVLLSKYESSNKKMAQLLEEKQSWDKAMNVANKKITTLERLCRALKEQQPEGKGQLAKSSSNNKTKLNSKKQQKDDCNLEPLEAHSSNNRTLIEEDIEMAGEVVEKEKPDKVSLQ